MSIGAYYYYNGAYCNSVLRQKTAQIYHQETPHTLQSIDVPRDVCE